MKPVLRFFPYVLLLAAMTFWGKALWIHAKAQLAQILIAKSWQETLANQQPTVPWPWADTWPVAKLSIPANKTQLFVLAGTHGSALAFGPGMAMQSPVGHRIIHGHRETHFSILKEIKVNDLVYLDDIHGQQNTYRVSHVRVVDTAKSHLWVESGRRGLMLITCYPFDAVNVGGPLRYVIEAAPVERNYITGIQR